MNKAMVDVQWAFLSIITASIAHFVLRIILGRELGPEGLGVYTLAFTIYLLGMQFAAFGIGASLTKYVAEFIDDYPTISIYVSSGMTSSIITGTLMGAALFFFAPYIAISFFNVPELEGLIRLIALCYPLISIQKAVLGTLNGFRRMHLYALLNIVQNISVVAASIILVISFGMGILGAVMGLVIPTILIGILSPIFIRESLAFNVSLWNKTALRATTSFGFYVVLSNSIAYLNTQMDSILIGYFLNPTEVGIYAVAALLAQTLTLIPSAVQRVSAPVTTTIYAKGDTGSLRRLIFSIMKKSFFLSICIAISIAILGQFLIICLFGKEFLEAYLPLLILLLGYTFAGTFAAVGSTLASIGKVRILFRLTAFCGVFNILLNIVLIPYFGLIGAAIGTSVTLIINFGLNLVLINSLLK